jgi:defect-in-organelle-trafficking protein DotB
MKSLPLLKFTDAYQYTGRFNSKEEFKQALLEAVRQKASDVYIQPLTSVIQKINGRMYAMGEQKTSFTDMEQLCYWASDLDGAMTTINSGGRINARFEAIVPSDTELEAPRRHGFRVNISGITLRGKATAQIVMRPIPEEPPIFSEIGLSEDIVKQMIPKNGIVVIAGETGAGKTTTFASVERYVLENDTPIKGNIITHEEPIEYVFDSIGSEHSIIVQSSIPENFPSFAAANVEAMRRKPSLIVIGEMREEQSIQAAVEAAKTGHPVFATVHAVDCATVVSRLITRFPATHHSTAINDICTALRFIMAQTLVPSIDGKLIAARSYIALTKEHRKALSLLTRVEDVSRAMQEILDTDGHSYSKEAKRMLSLGLIDEETAITIGRI